MQKRVYRALDNPTEYFGVRGKYLIVFGLLASFSMILAIVVGTFTMMIVGGAVFILGAGLSWIIVQVLDSKIREDELFRTIGSLRYPQTWRVSSLAVRNIWKGWNLPRSSKN